MKILFFSDLHIHNTHRFSHITENGRTIRENEHLSCAYRINELVDKYNVDKIVFGGDAIATVGDTLSTQCLDTLSEFIEIIQKKCIDKNIDFDILVGNHDLSSSTDSYGIHKLRPFKLWRNVNVYDRPKLVGNFIYMPYNSNDETAQSFLEGIENKKDKIIFSHLEIKNIDLGGNIYTKKGVDIEILKQFKMTLQGHYHSGYNLAKNIIVSGSTQRLSFKDKGTARNNIILYDTDTNSYKRESFLCPDWLSFNDDTIEDILNIDNDNYVFLKITSDFLLTDKIKEKLNKVKNKEIMIDITRISTKTDVQENISDQDVLEILKTVIYKSERSEEEKQAIFEEGIRLIDKVKK